MSGHHFTNLRKTNVHVNPIGLLMIYVFVSFTSAFNPIGVEMFFVAWFPASLNEHGSSSEFDSPSGLPFFMTYLNEIY